MTKKNIYIILAFAFLMSITSCSTSTRTYVDPWPGGLYEIRTANKMGHKQKKERKKELRKIRKQRAKSRK